MTSAPTRPAVQAGASVRAPGRLHLGFLDPAGTLGRRFGSIGLVIDGFETEVELRRARTDQWQADTQDGEAELARAVDWLQRMRRETGRTEPLQLRLRRALPVHAGFGSGTQLALAVGRAFAACHALEVDTPTLARWLGRGLRSGIGIAGFDLGGLLVDGGPAANGMPAPLLARLVWPQDWHIIVVLEPTRRGLSGAEEREAIAALPSLPRAGAAEICHQVLMRLLPGAAQADFAGFAAGLNAVQQVLGDHFAPAQGGSPWTSPSVARLMHWLAARHEAPVALGQSSWGPTGFAIVDSPARAQALIESARAAGAVEASLVLQVVRGLDRGAWLGGLSAP
ncbi:MAG: beta-ribofuranosylaminobenzene 5'-phosphate synthase [Piscinibacter sp.]|nr:beta-ribofuranosylaminobenzene 5'-phosphate synthase [Piscinibacter sp.]